MPRIDPELLAGALDQALAGRSGPLAGILRAHSNLPGPRGNLELAGQFVAAMAPLARGEQAGSAWAVVTGLAGHDADSAPTGDPGEFLAFCGTVASAVFAVEPARREAVWGIILDAAEDDRWRLREAAAQAVARATALDPPAATVVLREWAARGSWRACRAVAAGVADPPLLADASLAAEALRLHETILARLLAAPDRKDPGFRILRQGLGYSLSVVVAAAAEPGFALLRRLAAIPDRDLGWVLRSNLAKSRLQRAHPGRTAEVRAALSG